MTGASLFDTIAPPLGEHEKKLVQQICEVLDPSGRRHNEVAQRVRQAVHMLQVVAKMDAKTPSPAVLRKKLRQFAGSLRKSAMLAPNLFSPIVPKVFVDAPPAQGGVHFHSFVRDLKKVEAHAEALAATIVVRRGQQPWNGTGYTAKLLATNMLREFGRDPFAQGGGELTAQCARLLFEIVTGTEGADLTLYVTHEDRNCDRVEPSLTARTTFGG